MRLRCQSRVSATGCRYMQPPDPVPATEKPAAAVYYEDNAAPPGSGLYYACLLTDPGRRRQALALHTLESELLRSLTEVQDPGVARLRLQWWCEEIQRAVTTAARHPLAQTLQPWLQEDPDSGTDLIAAIQALEEDLTAGDCDNFESVEQQYSRIFGPLWQVSAALCGVRDRKALEEAARLGALHHMSRSLQNLPRSLAQGFCRPVPRRELEAAGLTAETLHQGQTTFLGQQTARLQEHLEQAWRQYPATEARPFLHGLILVRLDAALLGEIQRDRARLLQQGYALTPIRRLWLAWRTRRQVLRQASE